MLTPNQEIQRGLPSSTGCSGDMQPTEAVDMFWATRPSDFCLTHFTLFAQVPLRPFSFGSFHIA